MEKKIRKLEEKIKYSFKNKEFLINSLTHKSFNSEKNYEKLEFLGDRVLGIIISRKLIELYPNEKVGLLDKKFASSVNKTKCYEVGKSIELDNYILVGNNNKKKIKIENKIISDCCEALIGAIY